MFACLFFFYLFSGLPITTWLIRLMDKWQTQKVAFVVFQNTQNLYAQGGRGHKGGHGTWCIGFFFFFFLWVLEALIWCRFLQNIISSSISCNFFDPDKCGSLSLLIAIWLGKQMELLVLSFGPSCSPSTPI